MDKRWDLPIDSAQPAQPVTVLPFSISPHLALQTVSSRESDMANLIRRYVYIGNNPEQRDLPKGAMTFSVNIQPAGGGLYLESSLFQDRLFRKDR
jgi:hypothetical protein